MIEQRTEEWFAARLGRVTASRVSDVMAKPTTAAYQNYQAQLLCERLTGQMTETFQSPAMQHGTETEPRARAMYELETGNTVEETGFHQHPSMMAGASPDGLVGESGLLEIKCPQPATHLKTLRTGKIEPKYQRQMIWQMICTGREWCDFVSFSPAFPAELQLFCKRFDYPPEQAEEITATVTQFLAEIEAEEKQLRKSFMKEAA